MLRLAWATGRCNNLSLSCGSKEVVEERREGRESLDSQDNSAVWEQRNNKSF
ncbi:hypothetical protein GLYMA_05G019300v4 [Glycine max]|uniref:Uncharacterized protein n=2 Tax=Glycine subgen. Soja TaxID=1462606 RepID=A0A0R0JPC9_SOYBN|nr:hypothetical protein JHK87_011427 [Glycine soja]KAH1132371.1 hypothetical protein GYH30_011303 [Glycine max]KRH56780.1 hypothetical protein GLYMA_05G019300v4 [Glycine max]RZC10547.1 hypothetical protein D0Y65_011024 [Glycine soja]